MGLSLLDTSLTYIWTVPMHIKRRDCLQVLPDKFEIHKFKDRLHISICDILVKVYSAIVSVYTL